MQLQTAVNAVIAYNTGVCRCIVAKQILHLLTFSQQDTIITDCQLKTHDISHCIYCLLSQLLQHQVQSLQQQVRQNQLEIQSSERQLKENRAKGEDVR